MKFCKQFFSFSLFVMAIIALTSCTAPTNPPIKDNKTAPTPTNITFSDYQVTWNQDDLISSYLVVISINGETSEKVVYENSYDFSKLLVIGTNEITVQVTAHAGMNYLFDSKVATSSYTVIINNLEDVKTTAPTPTNLKVTNNVLSWNQVANISTYKVVVIVDNRRSEHTIYTNSYNFSQDIVSTTTSISFEVTAVAGTAYDYDSKVATITHNIENQNGSLDVDHESYYKDVLDLTGAALKAGLRDLITKTHTNKTSYSDCKKYLPYADVDLNNSNNMILFYSRVSVPKTAAVGNNEGQWNREHVWPQSLSWFDTKGAGADLHHIRPTDGLVNSTRNNNKYGEVSGGKTVYYRNTSIVCGKYGGGYFEPIDEVKGDVARIIFYLMTRYSESDSYSWTSVAQSYAILKKWHLEDPVSASEIYRNEYIYSIQGNYNPFIDCPEFAILIWG